MPQLLRFFPDYGADPLWDTRGCVVDLDSLPLTARVRADLRAWNRRWERLADADMRASGFAAGMLSAPSDPVTPDAWAQHEQEGHALAHRLQTELGDEYEIVPVDPDERAGRA